MSFVFNTRVSCENRCLFFFQSQFRITHSQIIIRVKHYCVRFVRICKMPPLGIANDFHLFTRFCCCCSLSHFRTMSGCLEIEKPHSFLEWILKWARWGYFIAEHFWCWSPQNGRALSSQKWAHKNGSMKMVNQKKNLGCLGNCVLFMSAGALLYAKYDWHVIPVKW